MATLVCFALKEEAAPFRKIVTDRTDIFIRIVGIGRKNGETSMREFFARGIGVAMSHPPGSLPGQARLTEKLAPPRLVLTCGFAGGLNPDLKLGQVVFEYPGGSPEMSDDKTEFKGDLESPHPAFQDCRQKLVAAGAKPAKFFCADRIATTVSEKKALRDQTGADAVEMESAAIHRVCEEFGIPCVTVRVISDPANEDLPLDFNALSKPDKSLDFRKLAWAIAKSPGKIGALMALQKNASFAARQLAEILVKLL